ncbi:MAG: DUF3793 family protein [Lachnospiraceae bacterium]|nr:DUF3793 family protein [Lachnospiraceae bacterium]
MSDLDLIEHCSPTLANIKPGNIVSCSYSSKEEVRQKLRVWNRALSGKGVRIIPLKYMKNRVLLYLYRPDWVERDLNGEKARDLLRNCGYTEESEAGCVTHLIARLRECETFPHEIGLFLGYPIEDVTGFILHKGRDFKYSGLWKVYGNVEKSKEQFRRYDRCRRAYYRQAANGISIETLTVRAEGRA